MARDLLCLGSVPMNSSERSASDSLASSTINGARALDVLECRMGRAQFAISTDAIDRIVEYRTWPMPLAKRWIGGLSLHAGVPLLSVALRRVEDTARRGATMKGILLKAAGSPIHWALEVDEVFVFVRIRLTERGPREDAKLPRWVNLAATVSSTPRPLWFVDVPAMLGDLADVDTGAENP